MGLIVGTVVDSTGTPIEGATVMITESPEPHSDIAGLTNASGEFKLAGLPHGKYLISVSHEAHVAVTKEVEIREEEVRTVIHV